jgi:adenylylsulfate kinase
MEVNPISRQTREEKNNQNGRVVWITGLPSSGKTTISIELEKRLFESDVLVYRLDGDIVRKGLSVDLGFSAEDRTENIRRIGEVSRLFMDATFHVIVAFISPYRKDRDRIRNLIDRGRFVEVFLDCPLSICEKRDVKGMYKKARDGNIKKFTGISSPYESPENPEIHLRTHEQSIEESVNQIVKWLNENPI